MKSPVKRLAALTLSGAIFVMLGLAPAPIVPNTGPTADPVHLYNTVRAMSTYPDGRPRTRFAFQPDMDSIGVALQQQMDLALAPAGSRASSERWPFNAEPCDTCGTCPVWSPSTPHRSVLFNIVGKLAGRNPGGAKFLITAHYDAIGCRTLGGWNAVTDPAPGADDNATGSAAVLELARILAQDPPYGFDIEFILFDGEEEVLLGSKDLAEGYKERGDRILGVLNMDMIGYNPRVDSLVVMTNRSSNYLAAYLVDTEALDPQPAFTLTREIANIGFSDHAPFWDRGYPAVLLIENIRIVGHNPTYHRVTDVPANLSRQGAMMAKGANVYLRMLRRLEAGSSGPPRLTMSDADLQATVNRASTPPVYAAPGDTLRVIAGVFNTGGPLPAGQDQEVRLYRVTDAGRLLLTEQEIHGPIENGGHAVIDYTFFATADDGGAITVEAETGEGASLQKARKAIPVRVAESRIVADYVAPNPVRDPGHAWFSYELSHEATVHVSLYDLRGNPVGDRTMIQSGKPDPGSGVEPGLNRVALKSLFAEPGEIAPGVYLYRLEISTESGRLLETKTGKFAILR